MRSRYYKMIIATIHGAPGLAPVLPSQFAKTTRRRDLNIAQHGEEAVQPQAEEGAAAGQAAHERCKAWCARLGALRAAYVPCRSERAQQRVGV